MQETQEMQVQSLDREDSLEKELATHSSILAWKIPWTEEPVHGIKKSWTWLSNWACTQAVAVSASFVRDFVILIINPSDSEQRGLIWETVYGDKRLLPVSSILVMTEVPAGAGHTVVQLNTHPVAQWLSGGNRQCTLLGSSTLGWGYAICLPFGKCRQEVGPGAAILDHRWGWRLEGTRSCPYQFCFTARAVSWKRNFSHLSH